MAVTRTAVVPNPASAPVVVSAGQYLHFRLGAGGPVPIFAVESHFCAAWKWNGDPRAAMNKARKVSRGSSLGRETR